MTMKKTIGKTARDPFRKYGAECVWTERTAQPNSYADFRHVFSLTDKCSGAVLYISADGEYEVRLNGVPLGGLQYSGYPLRRAYDAIPAGGALKEGENILSIRVFYEGADTMRYAAGEPYLVYALPCGTEAYVSGEETRCRKTPSYRQDPGMEWITPQLGFTFEYDTRKEDGWRDAEYREDASWHTACAGKELTEKTVFFPRPVSRIKTRGMMPARILSQGTFSWADPAEEPLGARMQHASLAFRAKEGFLRMETREHFYDHTVQNESWALAGMEPAYVVLKLREPAAGFFSVTLTAGAGTVLHVAYGEHLEDLRVRSAAGARSYAFSMVCRGGTQTFTHPFRRVGGQYLQVFITPKGRKPVIRSMGILPLEYPVKRTGEIRTGDRLFDRITEVADRTLRLCMHDHYEDCPFREQALYGMDSHLQMLTGYYLYDNDDMALASLRLLAEGAYDNGLLRICSPSGWPFTIPSFSLWWVVSLRDFALYTGRVREAAELLPTARGILSAAAEWFDGTLLRTQSSLFYWNFYEWCEDLDDREGVEQVRKHTAEYDAPLNALYCFAADAYGELCGWADAAGAGCGTDGNGDASAAWFAARAGIRRHFHSVFYDGESGLYRSYTGRWGKKSSHEYTYSLALLAGLVPAALRRKAMAVLADPDSPLVKSTLSCCFYKYRALLLQEKKDRGGRTVYPYAEYVFSDIAEKWGHMLFSGAETFWETAGGAEEWENGGDGGASLCHGWSAVPVWFFFAYLLGIRPTAPGYAAYTRQSAAESCGATGKIHTPAGWIRENLNV